MARRIVGDGRVLLLTLFLSGSAIVVLPKPVPIPCPTGAATDRATANKLPVNEPVAESTGAAVVTSADVPASGKTGMLADEQQLAAELMIPVEGVFAADLRDTFSEMRGKRRHEAIDILAPRGTPIVSAAAGRVLQISNNGAGGRMVFAADSTGRFLFLYAHLDGYADDLEEGMPLRRGQLLGYVGTSGNAPRNTPHLHFAIKRASAGRGLRWSRGTAIDPRRLFLPQPEPDPQLPDHPFPETQPPAP